MINIYEVNETNAMIDKENLDVRTITMGISLLDCADGSLEKVKNAVYDRITSLARNLVKTGEDIGREFGIPIMWRSRKFLIKRRTRWALILSADIRRRCKKE